MVLHRCSPLGKLFQTQEVAMSEMPGVMPGYRRFS